MKTKKAPKATETQKPTTRRPYRPKVAIEIQEHLHKSLERLAAAGNYTEGVTELALETWIDEAVILESVARSIIRLGEPDRETINHLAAVLLQEQLRHSSNEGDRWTAKHALGMEVDE